MAVDIVTKEDLQHFHALLLNDIKEIIQHFKNENDGRITEGYKTKDIRKLLGCCNNTIVSLRISGKLRCKRVGGALYYKREDVQKLLEEGF